jgi:hypothetical protein
MSVLDEKLQEWREVTEAEAPSPGLVEQMILEPRALRRVRIPVRPRWGRRALAGAVAAASLAAAVIAFIAWPRLPAPPVLPSRDQSELIPNVPIELSFGLGEGVDWEHADQKVFHFELESPVKTVAVLHFQARDISANEVVVSVNGTDVGYVPPDTFAVNERSHEVVVPASTLIRNGRNFVIFDNTRNPPGQETWRIWNVWIETFPLPELASEELIRTAQESMRRGQDLQGEHYVGAGRLYQGWRAYREAWLTLESIEGRKPMEYTIARDKMREAQSQLDKVCSKLLLEAQQNYNAKNFEAARSTLEHVNEYFPKRDQPCPLRAEQLRELYGI